MMTKHLMIVAALAAVAQPAIAQDGRFVLERTDDGYVRMDTATGQMSLCLERNGDIVCRLAADESATVWERLDELEGRIERLEEMMAQFPGESGLPSDQEFDRSMDAMEEFFRRFKGIIDEFEGDEPAPDRT